MTLILSLDDDEALLTLLGVVLERAGYEYLCTTNSHEAMSLLHSQPIDLFTQDISRPDIDGVEFYQLMKADESMRHIPVLFVSARAEWEFSEECRSDYGDEYLTKPVSPQGLATAVAGFLTRRGKHVPTEEERAAKWDQVRAKYPQFCRSKE